MTEYCKHWPGFLLTEAGADFSKHGWRAFVLMIALAMFVYAAFGMLF